MKRFPFTLPPRLLPTGIVFYEDPGPGYVPIVRIRWNRHYEHWQGEMQRRGSGFYTTVIRGELGAIVDFVGRMSRARR